VGITSIDWHFMSVGTNDILIFKDVKRDVQQFVKSLKV